MNKEVEMKEMQHCTASEEEGEVNLIRKGKEVCWAYKEGMPMLYHC